MQIKRFTARSMSEALQMVKAELGPEAIILTARSVKKNGIFLDAFRKAGVEVTAAREALPMAASRQAAPDTVQFREPAMSYYRARGHKAYEVESGSASAGISIAGDRNGRHPDRAAKDEKLRGSWLYRHLIGQDVHQEYALEISSESLAESGVDEFRDERLQTTLERALQKVGVDTRPMVSPGAKRVAFVGPAGAGKTSCVAKLASIHSASAGKRVAIISLDNYRVAAVDQLQRCADIIGIPVVAAGSTEELHGALDELETADLILIDTPALRRTDRRMREELRDNLRLAAADDIHFVCSASRKEKDTLELIEMLADMPINRLLFTKLDETGTYGNLLNLLIQLQIPASGFSSGQHIPGSLEAAAVEKLAGLLLDGKSQVADNTLVSVSPKKRAAGKSRRKTPAAAFIANKNTHLFHTADCTWTRLIKKENRVLFTSAAEALNRKFKPCQDCCADIAEPPVSPCQSVCLEKAAGAGGAGGDSKGLSHSKPPDFIPVWST